MGRTRLRSSGFNPLPPAEAEGRDRRRLGEVAVQFQSTSPRRSGGKSASEPTITAASNVSIHFPPPKRREESNHRRGPGYLCRFQSTSPRRSGGKTSSVWIRALQPRFQSTSPRRSGGKPSRCWTGWPPSMFQSTSPRRSGGKLRELLFDGRKYRFNPLPPAEAEGSHARKPTALQPAVSIHFPPPKRREAPSRSK